MARAEKCFLVIVIFLFISYFLLWKGLYVNSFELQAVHFVFYD